MKDEMRWLRAQPALLLAGLLAVLSAFPGGILRAQTAEDRQKNVNGKEESAEKGAVESAEKEAIKAERQAEKLKEAAEAAEEELNAKDVDEEKEDARESERAEKEIEEEAREADEIEHKADDKAGNIETRDSQVHDSEVSGGTSGSSESDHGGH